MKKNICFIFIFLFLLVLACSKDFTGFNVDCDECYYTKPDSANLLVYITINEENPSVPLVFYRGKIEDNIIEWIDTSTVDLLKLYSPVDKYYSVKALYKEGAKVIYAIDGDKLNTRQVSGVCDRDCWVVGGGILDVRLK
jgi:hypothetical protein